MSLFLFTVGTGNPLAPTVTPGVDLTGLDLITRALIELGSLNPTEAPAGKTADWALGKLNLLFDSWNADRLCVFASAFAPFTLTPGLSPHTIGPTGTFVVTQRPETLEGANLLLPGSSPTIRRACTLRSRDWWRQQPAQGLSTSIPLDLYYEPAWPNGQLFFWPVPSQAAQIELLTRVTFAALTLGDFVSAPPGYREAIVLTLAEQLQPGMRVPMPEGLPDQARRARTRIYGQNEITPAMDTRDAGMPSSGRSTYDFRTGGLR